MDNGYLGMSASGRSCSTARATSGHRSAVRTSSSWPEVTASRRGASRATADLAAAFAAARESGGPYLLDCKVEQDENVYPMVQPGRATPTSWKIRGEGAGAMRHVLVALVQDEPAMLARMGNLFARRGYNVESFTAGASELPGVTRITIVVEGSSHGPRPDRQQFRKLIGAVKVADVTSTPTNWPTRCCWVKVG